MEGAGGGGGGGWLTVQVTICIFDALTPPQVLPTNIQNKKPRVVCGGVGRPEDSERERREKRRERGNRLHSPLERKREREREADGRHLHLRRPHSPAGPSHKPLNISLRFRVSKFGVRVSGFGVRVQGKECRGKRGNSCEAEDVHPAGLNPESASSTPSFLRRSFSQTTESILSTFHQKSTCLSRNQPMASYGTNLVT